MKVDLSFEIDAEAVIAIAEAAGDVILEVYNSPTYVAREMAPSGAASLRATVAHKTHLRRDAIDAEAVTAKSLRWDPNQQTPGRLRACFCQTAFGCCWLLPPRAPASDCMLRRCANSRGAGSGMHPPTTPPALPLRVGGNVFVAANDVTLTLRHGSPSAWRRFSARIGPSRPRATDRR